MRVVTIDGEQIDVSEESSWLTGPRLVMSTVSIGEAWIRIVALGFDVRRGDPRKVADSLGADAVGVASNDQKLAELWLDRRTVRALTQVFWVTSTLSGGDVLVRGANLTLAGSAVSIWPAAQNPEHLDAVIGLGALIASRPRRLARELAEVAAQLGGEVTADRFALDGGFAIEVERDDTKVQIDWFNGAPGEPPRLRTRVHAESTLEIADVERERARHSKALHQVAIESLQLAGGEVVLTSDGALLDPRALAACVELIARCARRRVVSVGGPYR